MWVAQKPAPGPFTPTSFIGLANFSRIDLSMLVKERVCLHDARLKTLKSFLFEATVFKKLPRSSE